MILATQPEEDSAIGSSSVTSMTTDDAGSASEQGPVPICLDPTGNTLLNSASSSSFGRISRRSGTATADWLDKGDSINSKGYIQARVIHHDPIDGHYVIKPMLGMPPGHFGSPMTSPKPNGRLGIVGERQEGVDLESEAGSPSRYPFQNNVLDPLLLPQQLPTVAKPLSSKKCRSKRLSPVSSNNNCRSAVNASSSLDRPRGPGQHRDEAMELEPLTICKSSPGCGHCNNMDNYTTGNLTNSKNVDSFVVRDSNNNNNGSLDSYSDSAQTDEAMDFKLPHHFHRCRASNQDCSLTVGLVGGQSLKRGSGRRVSSRSRRRSCSLASLCSSIFCSELPCWLLFVVFAGLLLLFSAAFVGFCSGAFCTGKSGDESLNIGGVTASAESQKHNLQAHTTDPLRLDIIVPPGDQHYYLRATSPQERQAWLQHLGTVKACAHSNAGDAVNDNSLRRKYCELRVYCDLLMQQVHSIKSIVTDSPIPNVQKLDETTALLSETCDTFIHTLEDCLQLATPGQLSPTGSSGSHKKVQDSSFPKLHSPNPNSSAAGLLGTDSDLLNKLANVSSDIGKGYDSPNSPNPDSTRSPRVQPIVTGDHSSILSVPGKNDSLIISPQSSGWTAGDGEGNKSSLLKVDDDESTKGGSLLVIGEPPAGLTSPGPPSSTTVRYETFFSSDEVTFATLMLEQDGGLPSSTFLDACRHLIKIFDSLGSSAFAPVKMDLNGNIRKLAIKYKTDPEAFSTMQRMVASEIKNGTTERQGSATDALLWLKRGIWFVREFLVCFAANDRELADCASEAYSRTLRPFHGWVVRGMFSLASSAVPSRTVFISSLANVNPEVETSPAFKEQVSQDLTAYLSGLDRTLRTLNLFYKKHNLDPSLDSAEKTGIGPFV